MGRISSKTLVEDNELDDLLKEEDTIFEDKEDEDEVLADDEEDEEYVPKSVKRRKKVQEKKDNSIYVTLKEAATYTIDGMVFRRNETQKVPLSKLPKFKDNGWFTIRY